MDFKFSTDYARILRWCFYCEHLQALPIYLDKPFNQYVAIILSVTLVLAFGEVC